MRKLGPAYSEGTWTPVLTFATAGDLSVAYSEQAGYWTRVGRLVYVVCNLATSSFTHTTASGNLQVSGQPFSFGSPSLQMGALSWAGITKASYTQIAVLANSTLFTFTASGSGQAASAVTTADVPTGGAVRLRFSMSYMAA